MSKNQSLSELLDDGDTTEEDLELFSDKYVGNLDENSLSSALEAMRLDNDKVESLFEWSREEDFEEQSQRVNSKPVILPPPSSELYNLTQSVEPTVEPRQIVETTPPPQSETKVPITPQDKIINIIPPVDDLHDFYQTFSTLNLTEQAISKEQTLILLSPLSYQHVFSRSWVRKQYSDSVVERPERLMAASIGIGSAIAKSPFKYKLETSKKRKDLRNAAHVSNVHGSEWAKNLYQLCQESTDKLKKGQIEVPTDWHEGDIYLTGETIDALEGVLGVSELAVDKVFTEQHSKVFVSIRPPGHHSHPCVPSGFCLINNVHIAIQYAKQQYNITHAVILDFDLHHGDGSQDICWKLAGFEDDELEKAAADTTSPLSIGYFSVHDINSFPTELGYATADNIKNASVCLMAHGMCIWNVHLEPYKDEAHFNEIYKDKYSVLFEKARQFLNKGKRTAADNKQPFKPLIILSAGFDSSEHEYQSMQRHQVSVPTSFFNKFTNDSVKLANEFADGKIISMLEGGYSDAALSTGIFSHLTGLAEEEWDAAWCNGAIVKQYSKGCKVKWKPTGTSSEPDWVTKGVELGRSLWPQQIKTQIPSTTRKSRKPDEEQNYGLPTPLRVLRDSTRKAHVG